MKLKLITIISLLLLIVPFVTAVGCTGMAIYYGTCSPEGTVSIYLENPAKDEILVKQTQCISLGGIGVYATKVATLGSGCFIDPYDEDTLRFEIDAESVGKDIFSNAGWLRNLNLEKEVIAPPPVSNLPPEINVHFDSPSFKTKEDNYCNGEIKDPEGDLISSISATFFDSESIEHNLENILDSHCTIDSDIVNCKISTLDIDLPVGYVECMFYAKDNLDNLASGSDSAEVINTLPVITSSFDKVEVNPGTLIEIDFSSSDEDGHNVILETQFQKGELVGNKFTWTVEELGEYNLIVTGSDGFGETQIIIPISVVEGVVVPPSPPPPPPPPPTVLTSSGGSSSAGGSSGISQTTCASVWEEVESLSKLCKGKPGQKVRQKFRQAQCPTKTEISIVHQFQNKTCPGVPESKEETPRKEAEQVKQQPQPQKTEQQTPQKPSNLWVWLIIGLVGITILSGIIFELNQHGVFDHKPPLPPPIKTRKISEPPRVSSHVTVNSMNAKIKKAASLFKNGKIDQVKSMIKDIESDYKLMSPEFKEEVYHNYMQLYEYIQSK
jgi:plastocyanin